MIKCVKNHPKRNPNHFLHCIFIEISIFPYVVASYCPVQVLKEEIWVFNNILCITNHLHVLCLQNMNISGKSEVKMKAIQTVIKMYVKQYCFTDFLKTIPKIMMVDYEMKKNKFFKMFSFHVVISFGLFFHFQVCNVSFLTSKSILLIYC